MKSSQIHALSESELKLSPPLLRESVNWQLLPADARLFAAIGETKRETIGEVQAATLGRSEVDPVRRIDLQLSLMRCGTSR